MAEVCRNFAHFAPVERSGAFSPPYLPLCCPKFVFASFSMLRTMQYRVHCVLTLARPRWFSRVRRLLCRMLPRHARGGGGSNELSAII